jgi:nucleotide-binding universal stress UspA family protein
MSKPSATRFARILVATDGSPSSQQACEVAAQIATGFDSKVTVLSAIPSISALAAPLEGEYYSKIINKAEDAVEKAASAFKRAGVTVSEKESPQGRASPVETILEYADEEKTDLIAMGTRGMGGIKRAVLGSVSSGVAMHARCSTLVVRPTKRKEGALPVGRAVVAIDGSENAQRALETAVDMATRLKLELQIVHVDYVPGLLWSMGLPGSIIPEDRIENDAESFGEQLVAGAIKFAKEGGVANPKGEMVTKLTSPAQAIVELAEERKADIIVIGTRGLGGFKKMLLGSVANSVLHYAHCSVLVVK